MAKITEVRLTLAALIYAIEIDLKNLIGRYLIPVNSNLNFIQDEELQNKIKNRFSKDYPAINPDDNLSDVIEYLDFQEFYTLLLRNKSLLPEDIYNEIKALVPELDELVPIRNRVMHTRPLLVGDFTKVYSFIEEISNSCCLDTNWQTVRETKKRIEDDPSYVLTLSMPSVKNLENEVYHNLPIPDFDDTGFIGRKKDIQDIKNLILGNNRVVSIIGDGGIGKTALALKIAYDILDLRDKNPFDIVLWCSAKTTMLTAQGITDIKNALQDYGGLLEFINDIIGEKKEADNLEIILEYLEVFNVLLIIDNLETILDEKIREFIREASQRSKIIITSRIGLGELEFRRNLLGLSEAESIVLVRQFANLKQSEILKKIPNDKLVQIAHKLHFNPLALKWFVNSVETGISPDEVLVNKENLLNFCLSNVHSKLSDNAKNLLDTLLASRRNLNDAQLVFLTELPSIMLRQTINELFATTFISREIIHESGSQEIRYVIPDFSREYLLSKHPIPAKFIKDINSKLKKIDQSAASIQRVTDYNEFGLYSLTVRNSNEKVVARLINEALKHSKSENFPSALNKLDEAKSILPNYFEIYRVSAFVKATSGDIIGAEEDYKTGLSIEPDNPRLLYFYSGFLLYQLDDVKNAIELAAKLHEIRPDSEYPTFLFARCLSTIGKNVEAINLIENLIKSNRLNQHNLRVAQTDLISFYGYYGVEIVKRDGDYKNAIEKFEKGLKLFEECVANKNHDERMIKNFCNLLKTYLKTVPKLQNVDGIDYLKSLFTRYDEILSLNQSKNYLLSLFQNNYDETIEYAPSLEGIVVNIDKERSFIFIENIDGERFYGHKKVFKYQTDFHTIKLGQKVKFDIGNNKQGECAIKIEISSAPNRVDRPASN